ncbi:MAG: hypothetical protein M1142_00275 [Patescibacteria group bacterium]|nr:hypothetical protein [Patescibacteria group bacterium]
MRAIVFIIFSLLLLVYLLAPGPSSINDFSPLPASAKSTLSGDTVQVPNVSAYYSDEYRNFTTNFYRQHYQELTKFFFLPIRLNYPPEFAYTAIKDQTESTYLEEYVYPLRDSLFVNGMEPFENGLPRYAGAIKFLEAGQAWETKATLRFYPSPLWARGTVWLGINIAFIGLWKLGRRIAFNV